MIDAQEIRQRAHQIRLLTIDAIEKAKCGHPGLPLGMADIAAVLWSHHLKFHPEEPNWPNQDRFILSAGHGSMLLYSLLHLYGYDLTLEDLQHFRQWQSKTPGHPEYQQTPGIHITTGPLGQGLGSAVGFALAEKILAKQYNRPGKEYLPIVDHYTYVFASDGDLMEGLSHEACSLAGHWNLSKLIVFFDDNEVSIDGNVNLASSDNVEIRFSSYGWEVIHIDGHNIEAIDRAIKKAQQSQDKPVLIVCKTIIGYGSPNRAGTAKAHGEALGAKEAQLTKEKLVGKNLPPFSYIIDVAKNCSETRIRGQKKFSEWHEIKTEYQRKYPQRMQELEQRIHNQLPKNWAEDLQESVIASNAASRKMSGQIIEKIIQKIPGLIGGSADLTPSVNTFHQGMQSFNRKQENANYLHFGVREHAMGAIMNGLSLHGGFIPYGGTFLVFSDYMRPSIRLAAMMGIQVIYIFTHDSIALGEDGPTHQPIEHLTSLRAIPNLKVLRPASPLDCIRSWKIALANNSGPTCIILSRQTIPPIKSNFAEENSTQTHDKNDFVVSQSKSCCNIVYQSAGDTKNINVLFLATGSEVPLAIAVAKKLDQSEKINSRVISFLDFTDYAEIPENHKAQIFLHEIDPLNVAIEAGRGDFWYRYFHNPTRSLVIGIEQFGASAPYPLLYEMYGFSVEKIVGKILKTLSGTAS